MAQERYLTIRELAEWLGLGRSTIQRRIADGTLPKPLKIGHLSRFRESELIAALELLEAQREP